MSCFAPIQPKRVSPLWHGATTRTSPSLVALADERSSPATTSAAPASGARRPASRCRAGCRRCRRWAARRARDPAAGPRRLAHAHTATLRTRALSTAPCRGGSSPATGTPLRGTSSTARRRARPGRCAPVLAAELRVAGRRDRDGDPHDADARDRGTPKRRRSNPIAAASVSGTSAPITLRCRQVVLADERAGGAAARSRWRRARASPARRAAATLPAAPAPRARRARTSPAPTARVSW